MKVKSWFVLLILALLASCDSNRVFEKNDTFKNNEWVLEDTLTYEVKIDDFKEKNILINLRHQFYFNWRNIWLNLNIIKPNGTSINTPVNMMLSENDVEWVGKCSADICEINYPLDTFQKHTFEDTGKYIFKLSHAMRADTLKKIISAGIRVENHTAE